MKGHLLPAVLALAVSPMSFAGVTYSFFPAQPTITEPTDGATDVETSATVSTNVLTEVNAQGTTNSSSSLTLDGVQWYLTTDADSTVTYFGGLRATASSAERLAFMPEESYDYTVPENVSLSFDSLAVPVLRIYNTGKLELISEADVVIGTVYVQPDLLGAVKPDTTDARITVKAYDNGVSVIWPFIADDASNAAVKMEALLLDNAIIVVRADPADLSDSLYTLTGGNVGVELDDDSNTGSLAGWKSGLTGTATEFGLKFTRTDASTINSSTASPTTLSSYTEPTTTTETVDNVTGELSLLPGEEYRAYAQYVVTDGSGNTVYSSLSDAVMFTTELNSSYTLDLPSTDGIVAATPVELTFSLSNTGEHGGAPKVEVVLPFNALENLNGTLSDFFDAETEATEADCGLNIAGGDTTLSCTTLMDAGESATVDFTATFNTVGAQDIEYRVCETKLNGCEGIEYKTLTINVSSADSGDGNGSDDSSSSGGGSTFWFLLLSLPLTLLRRSR